MVTIPQQREQTILHWYKEQFNGLCQQFKDHDEGWNIRDRQGALEALLQKGFPHRKDENWRFTNIQPITQQHFTVVERCGEIVPEVLDRAMVSDVYRVTIIDGFFSPQYSDVIPSLTLLSLRDALRADQENRRRGFGALSSVDQSPFALLNSVFYRDGLYLAIPEGVVLDKPIFVVFVTTAHSVPTLITPRSFYSVGKGSRATIFEKHITTSEQTYFVSSVTEVMLDEGAHLNYTRVYEDGVHGYHITTTNVLQNRESVLTSNVVVFGGAIHRNDFVVSLRGEQSEASLYGLSFGSGSQLIDHHTAIEHTYPHCKSRELYKAVLDGKARGVFNGKVYVHPRAQKTDAQQSNKTLLLSDDATMHTKPQLEIFADDVRCTHGAAIGQLDESQLFYLRSRGIDELAARTLLTFGFANETLETIQHLPLRKQIEDSVARKLQNRSER